MRKNLYTAFGETKSIYEWIDDPRCVVPFSTLKGRLYNNPDKWSSFEDAITTPFIKERGSPPKGLTSINRRKSHQFEELNDPRWLANKTIRQVMADVGCTDGAAARAFKRFNLKPVKATTQGLHQEKTVEGKTAKEWKVVYKSDIGERLFWARLRQGWSIEDALNTPPREYPLLEAFGEKKILSDWIRDDRCVSSRSMIRRFMDEGISLEDALSIPAQEVTLHEAFGERKTVADWSRDPRCAVGPTTLYSRICELGVDPELAILTQPKSFSMTEQMVAEYVSGLGFDIVQNTRSVIPPKELDIFVPQENLAIEFNGLYWHSASRLAKDYHKLKYEACSSAGVQLIQIWEDDWNRSSEILKRMLAHKLGVSDLPSFGASKCKVVDVSTTAARTFLEANHIQGYASSGVKLGLVTKKGEDLVAIMTFRSSMDVEWELVRYATSIRVPGGFSKLLSAFRSQHPGTIKTFADLMVSNGSVYQKSGFVLDRVLEPDYRYVVKGERVHKFNYRIQRFRSDPDLLFEEGMTETQLAELNGLERVYDAGKARYVLT